MKIAEVKFFAHLSSECERKIYHYITNIDDLQPYDLVIVDTMNGPRVAAFIRYSKTEQTASRWILQKVVYEKGPVLTPKPTDNAKAKEKAILKKLEEITEIYRSTINE